jgi:L-lactate dehydrogenase
VKHQVVRRAVADVRVSVQVGDVHGRVGEARASEFDHPLGDPAIGAVVDHREMDGFQDACVLGRFDRQPERVERALEQRQVGSIRDDADLQRRRQHGSPYALESAKHTWRRAARPGDSMPHPSPAAHGPSPTSAADPGASQRYAAERLRAYADALLTAADMRADMARDVASILLDGDLMGHTTHGLALLPGYLGEITQARMGKSGEPATVHASAAAQTWDGRRLPGPWLVLRALDAAHAMAKLQGSGTVVIRRSHHIACLAAYAKRATDRGVMALICCSDPATHSVAPFGAVTSVFTPNPLAAGIPTSGEPILLDISASYTTNGMTIRLHQAGESLPHPWVQDAQGNPTRDPAVLFAEPKGTLLPIGGLEAGHKGYALALLIEALTGGLAGHGRADPAEGWGATVFVQVLDPAAFGGAIAFAAQMDWLARACRDATPRPGGPPVRLPGERALRLHRKQSAEGVALHPTIMPALAPWAQKLGVAPPAPLA